MENSSANWANTAQAFTVDKDGNPKFTLKLLDNEYLLLGDDRIVSKDRPSGQELSRKNKSKGKPSLDYGLSTLSKLISIDQKTKAEQYVPALLYKKERNDGIFFLVLLSALF